MEEIKIQQETIEVIDKKCYGKVNIFYIFIIILIILI